MNKDPTSQNLHDSKWEIQQQQQKVKHDNY